MPIHLIAIGVAGGAAATWVGVGASTGEWDLGAEAMAEVERQNAVQAAYVAEQEAKRARYADAMSDLGQQEGNRTKVQRFLNVYIDELAAASQRFNGSRWTNFGIVNSENPGTLIDQLSQRGVKEFMSLTPVQMSLLQPMFRIYVDASTIGAPSSGEYTQLHFPSHIDPGDIERIFDGEQSRPSGVWFISFDWKDIGNTPTMENTMFDCTLKFGCESLAALDAPQDSNNPRTNFKELLRPVSPGTPVGVRIQVGWTPPVETDIIDGDLVDAIHNMQKIFDCSMTGYNIDFKENGTIEVEVKYIAGIDKANAEPGNDLLRRDGETYEERQEDTSAERETAGLTMVNGEGGTEEAYQLLTTLRSIAGERGVGGAEQTLQTTEAVARLQEISGYFTPHYDAGAVTAGGLSPDALLALGGTAGEGETPSPGLNETFDGDVRILAAHSMHMAEQLFTPDGKLKGGVTADRIDRVLRSLDAASHFQSQGFRVGLRNRMGVAYSAIVEYLRENGRIYTADLDIDHLLELTQEQVTDPNYIDSLEIRVLTMPISDNTQEAEMFDQAHEAIEANIEVNEDSLRGDTWGGAWSANLAQYSRVDGENRTVRALWFYLGDLLEYAFDRNFWAVEAQHYHALVGPITLTVTRGGVSTPTAINLADIPINLSTFMIFIQRQMEKRGGGATKGASVATGPLTVKTFVQDVFNDIVIRRLGDDSNRGAIQASQDHSSDGTITVDVMTFMSVPYDDGTYLFEEGTRTTVTPTTDIPMIYSHHIADVQSYYYMFAASARAENRTGDEDDDQLVPIYHLRYGRENGIVKAIKFTREDTKYFQEGVIMAAFGDNPNDNPITTQIRAGSAPSLLKYVYRLEATLYGNVLFNPGCKIYLKPEYPGTPIGSNIIADLGLGGYYFITSVDSFLEAGKFETRIKGYLELVYTGTVHGTGQFNSVSQAFGADTFEGGATGVVAGTEG